MYILSDMGFVIEEFGVNSYIVKESLNKEVTND